MTCTAPVKLQFQDLLVPCGKCIACKIAHSREWSTRLLHELDSNGHRGIFVTLTYNDDNLPIDGSIRKEVLQKFFKRLRKNLNGRKIKYYAAGEYGDKFNRPHYHAIIINMTWDEKPIIEKSWNFGFVYIGTVTYDSCRYVADYVMKKWNGKKAELEYGNKEPPFQLQSYGMGLDFIEKNGKQIIERGEITINGQNVGIPRYYKKKLGLDSEYFGDEAKKRREELNAELYKRGINDDGALAELKQMYLQKSREILKRMEIKDSKK